MPDVEDNRPLRVKARWVFPVASPPIENGVIEIQNGQITAVHGRPDAGAIDLGPVALTPGLVNAHTHLEFSDLLQPVQPAIPFTAWIRSLVTIRRGRPATAALIQMGLDESARAGTATFGEIATQDWPDETYQHSPLSSIVFREILGLRYEQIEIQLDVARRWLDDASQKFDVDYEQEARGPVAPRLNNQRTAGPGNQNNKSSRETMWPQLPVIHGETVRGLSPHAPYSVHPELYRKLIDLAAERNAPIAIHLAETRAELELLKDGAGEFVQMLQQFGAWDDTAIPRDSRPLDYLQPLEKVSRALVIHGNYLDQTEMNWLRQQRHVSVVYCPRTHAFFGHTTHPWRTMLDQGIKVAIGTDSRGSNPDLSVWREMLLLRTLAPEVDPAVVLELGTLAGARALGLDARTGSIEVGKRAHLTLAKLPETSRSDPYEGLFSATDVALFSSPEFVEN